MKKIHNYEIDKMAREFADNYSDGTEKSWSYVKRAFKAGMLKVIKIYKEEKITKVDKNRMDKEINIIDKYKKPDGSANNIVF